MEKGSLVLCINDYFPEDTSLMFGALPVKLKTYTVRRVIPNPEVRNGEDGIALEGIYGNIGGVRSYTGKIIYEEYHFRKNRFIELLPPMNKNKTAPPALITKK